MGLSNNEVYKFAKFSIASLFLTKFMFILNVSWVNHLMFTATILDRQPSFLSLSIAVITYL